MRQDSRIWKYAFLTLILQIAVYIFLIYVDAIPLTVPAGIKDPLWIPYAIWGLLLEKTLPAKPIESLFVILTAGPLLGMTVYALLVGYLLPRLIDRLTKGKGSTQPPPGN